MVSPLAMVSLREADSAPGQTIAAAALGSPDTTQLNETQQGHAKAGAERCVGGHHAGDGAIGVGRGHQERGLAPGRQGLQPAGAIGALGRRITGQPQQHGVGVLGEGRQQGIGVLTAGLVTQGTAPGARQHFSGLAHPQLGLQARTDQNQVVFGHGATLSGATQHYHRKQLSSSAGP